MSGPEVRRLISQPPLKPPPPTSQSPLPPPPPASRYQTDFSKTDSQQGAQETTERQCSPTHPRANSPAALIRSLPQDQAPTGHSTPNSRSGPPQPRSESFFLPPPHSTSSSHTTQPRHLRPQRLST